MSNTNIAHSGTEFGMVLHPRGMGRSVFANAMREHRQSRNLATIIHKGKSTEASMQQRSVVKVSYGKNEYAGQWAAHGKYLEREGAQEEGGKGRGFNAEQAELSLENTLNDWQKDGSPHVFRVIISPELGDKSDLKSHVKELMEQMQTDLNCKFQWAAIDHHNTDHPHVHVVINGQKEGNNTNYSKERLVIPKDYMRYGIRQRSSEILTRELGLRREKDIVAARDKSIEAKRVTELDRMLNQRSNSDGRLEIVALGSVQQRTLNYQLIYRLKYLQKIGLADKTGHISWALPNGFINALRQYQISQDIVKRRAQHSKALLVPNAQIAMTTVAQIAAKEHGLEGRVAASGLHDELKDQRYIMLEGNDGKLHYVTLDRSVQRRIDKLSLSSGDVICFKQTSFEDNGKAVVYMNVEQNHQMQKSHKVLPIDRRIVHAWQHGNSLTITGNQLNVWQKTYNQHVQGRIDLLREKDILKDHCKVGWQKWKEHTRTDKEHDKGMDR